MCGLAGILGPGPVESARTQVRQLLHQLRHRGPDGEGLLERPARSGGTTLVLGHRRLSIIDLSPAAGQPMATADGQLHLALNGEIYNYLELRRELEGLGHPFRTRSDTEVLLLAWRQWGAAALERVVGMFAFALLDEPRQRLVLARDPFAIKPLYYTIQHGTLAFASEIPPLLSLPGVSRTADPGPLADFLTRAVNNHEGSTLFHAVRELPGAHYVEIALDAPTRLSPVRYWSPPRALTHELPFDVAAERLGELLEESVRLHLRSDVPVGLLLSGGQDSSTVLALARRALGREADLHTFSYRGDSGAVDEGRWIEAARRATGAIGHDLRLTPEDWATDLPALLTAQGEPFGSPVIYAQRRLFQAAAAQGIRVVLDGQGSDEFLAGYDKFHAGRIASLLGRGSVWGAVTVARGYARGSRHLRRSLLNAAALRWPTLGRLRRRRNQALLDPHWLPDHRASLSPAWRPSGPDVLREMLGAELRAPNIPWLMRYADRNAMSFSIENRLPFLNHRVVDFVLGLPEEHLIAADGTGKRLLRAAMRGVVPDEIRARRDKTGFDVPLESWLPRTPGLQELLDDACHIPAVRRERASALAAAVRNRVPLRRQDAFEAWRLVTLTAWSRAFGATWS